MPVLAFLQQAGPGDEETQLPPPCIPAFDHSAAAEGIPWALQPTSCPQQESICFMGPEMSSDDQFDVQNGSSCP